MSAVNGLPAADAPPPLRCPVDPTFPVPVLRVVGRLDLRSSVGLRTAVWKTLAEEPAGVVLDIAELSVGDGLALTVFAALARTATQWPGCPVALSGPSPSLLDLLDSLAITRFMAVYATVDEAVAALSATASIDRCHTPLAGTPVSASRARALVADACAAWRLTNLLTEAQIVVTELVANAVRHAGGDLTLTLRRTERFLHLAVRDRSETAPVRRTPDPAHAESGRGLLLIDAIAAGWGSMPTGAGKVVWATLRLAG